MQPQKGKKDHMQGKTRMNLNCGQYREPSEQLTQLAQLSGNVVIAELSYFLWVHEKSRKSTWKLEMRTGQIQISASSKRANAEHRLVGLSVWSLPSGCANSHYMAVGLHCGFF